MANVTISPDQNTLIVDEQQFKFNPLDRDPEGEDQTCSNCAAFKLCCQLESTVDSSFPFPCFDRADGESGNFLAG